MNYDPFQQFAFNPFAAATMAQMPPNMAAAQLAGAGVPTAVPGVTVGPSVADFMSPQGGVPQAAPPAAPQMPPNMQGMGQMLQAVQRPQPQAPLMAGGVHGAQKAPDAKVDAGSQSAVTQMLMQLLQSRQPPLTVPTLGQLIGR